MLLFFRMNETSSDQCLKHVVATQIMIFRTLMDGVPAMVDGEATLCEHLVFLKRFALLNDSAKKHLIEESLQTDLIEIAGNKTLSILPVVAFSCLVPIKSFFVF